MKIVTKRPDNCATCGMQIPAGTKVNYNRERGVWHENCTIPIVMAPASSKQRQLLAKLYSERLTVGDPELAQDPSTNPMLDKPTASSLIQKLMNKPRLKNLAQGQIPELPDESVVPAGRYALQMEGTWVKLKVWRGRTGLVRCYLMGDTEDGSEVNAADALKRIVAAGPRESALAYGRLTGDCSICGLELRNALSRKLDIGPVCGRRFYGHNEWLGIKAAGRAWLRARGIDPSRDLPSDVNLQELETA